MRPLSPRVVELLNDALAAASRIPGFNADSIVLAEMPGPIGIPDLTVVVGTTCKRKLRLSSGIPPLLNRLDAAVLASLPSAGSRTPEAIARKLGWPQHVVERRLPHLLSVEAIQKSGKSGFEKNPAITSIGDIFVIEAKVSNWQRALEQAHAYSVWSNGYVLVLGDLSRETQVRVATNVAQDRGGLYVAGRWRRVPRKHAVTSASNLWASEHVVAALVNQKPSAAP